MIVLPTKSDDALVIIAPHEYVHRIEQMVEACDAPRQYVVKVQLLELLPDGKTIPVARPSLSMPVGREGRVQLLTPANDVVSVNVKVDEQPSCARASACGAKAECDDDSECHAKSECQAKAEDEALPECLHECGEGAACPHETASEQCPEAMPASPIIVRGIGIFSGTPYTEAGIVIEGATSTLPSSINVRIPLNIAIPPMPSPIVQSAAANAPCGCKCSKGLACSACESANDTEPPAFLSLSQEMKSLMTCSDAILQSNVQFWQSYQGRSLDGLFEHHFMGGELIKPIVILSSPSGLSIVDDQPSVAFARTEGGEVIIKPIVILNSPSGLSIADDQPSVSAETIAPAACPNCQEESRAILEEFFRTSGIGEITQVGHTQPEAGEPHEARAFPNVAHSKIETTIITYPLKDLVLLDDGGHPVFDTCTIIDHLQSAVAPGSWSHPSVSIQLDQQSVSLVIRQTREVHEKLQSHFHYLRRLQLKQICNLIEHMSQDAKTLDGTAKPEASLGIQSPAELINTPAKR